MADKDTVDQESQGSDADDTIRQTNEEMVSQSADEFAKYKQERAGQGHGPAKGFFSMRDIASNSGGEEEEQGDAKAQEKEAEDYSNLWQGDEGKGQAIVDEGDEETETDEGDEGDETEEEETGEESEGDEKNPKWLQKRLERERRKNSEELERLKKENERLKSRFGKDDDSDDDAGASAGDPPDPADFDTVDGWMDAMDAYEEGLTKDDGKKQKDDEGGKDDDASKESKAGGLDPQLYGDMVQMIDIHDAETMDDADEDAVSLGERFAEAIEEKNLRLTSAMMDHLIGMDDVQGACRAVEKLVSRPYQSGAVCRKSVSEQIKWLDQAAKKPDGRKNPKRKAPHMKNVGGRSGYSRSAESAKSYAEYREKRQGQLRSTPGFLKF